MVIKANISEQLAQQGIFYIGSTFRNTIFDQVIIGCKLPAVHIGGAALLGLQRTLTSTTSTLLRFSVDSHRTVDLAFGVSQQALTQRMMAFKEKINRYVSFSFCFVTPPME